MSAGYTHVSLDAANDDQTPDVRRLRRIVEQADREEDQRRVLRDGLANAVAFTVFVLCAGFLLWNAAAQLVAKLSPG